MITKLLSQCLMLTVVLSGLVACDSSPEQNVNYTYVPSTGAPAHSVDKNAQAQLAEAASSVSQSLQQLSAISMATHPGVQMPAPSNPDSIGMSQIVSVNWYGPVEPLLKKIAATSDYQLKLLGNPPETPIIVVVDQRNVPLADVLRNVTFQAATKAQIKVYPGTKVLELRYLGD